MRINQLRRRDLITLVGGAAATWPLAARAQREKVYRLGILAITRDLPRPWDGLFRGLRDHGYVEGQNLIIERRYSEGQGERWPELASELVGLKVDAIVVSTTPAALAAKKATSTIPIIIATAFDPVGAGLAASLARPGGNVTGLGLFIPEVSAKGLTLLKEAVPSLTRVAVLWNAANPALALVWRDVETTARAAGLVLHPEQVSEPQDFEAAFVAIAQERPGGLLVLVDALLSQYKSQIVEFTIHEHLPAVFQFREFAELGGLMSYGPNLPDMFRIAANYVDRVLKGAKPADLPIEQPTKFELVINLKTAKALSIEVPTSLLLRADELIE
jgi:putative ABC transport system substrate-binding protein